MRGDERQLLNEIQGRLTSMESKMAKILHEASPIPVPVMKRLIRYYFSELDGYATLTSLEREIITEAEFEQLFSWAFPSTETPPPTAQELNAAFEHVPEEVRPEFCIKCGALNSIHEGECRECHHPVTEEAQT